MPVSAEYVNTESGLNLRAQTTIKSEILALMPYGAEVKVSRTIGVHSEVWADAEYNGIHGFCRKEYLSDTNPLDGMTLLGNWKTTAYTWTGYRCADGSWPQSGYSAACNSLAFGTEIYVAGVGKLTITDRGPSSMPSEWLDIYMDSYNACVQYGVQYHDVYLVNNNSEPDSTGH